MVEPVDVGARLSMMQGNGPAKALPGLTSIFGGPVQRPTIQGISFFETKIMGQFTSKKPPSPQMQYEQQVCNQIKQAGDQFIAQNSSQASQTFFSQTPIQLTGGSFSGHGLGSMGAGGGLELT